MLPGETRPVDAQFAALMRRYAPEMSDDVLGIIAELSHALSLQHSCIDLHGRRKSLIHELESLTIVGDGAVATPLVLKNGRLFLHRYYQYECGVADALSARNRALPLNDEIKLQLKKHFAAGAVSTTVGGSVGGSVGSTIGGTINWQQIAVLQVLTRQLTIITGGPGTGKTSTVARILSMLRDVDKNLVIRLAAPTGKAAMRLAESILQYLPEQTGNSIPASVQTLHRFLGMRSGGRSYRYHRDNPVRVDLLIVDEVSMVDLTMMHRLLDALPEDSRLLLIGDPDQLPSVEAGNVLADLCRNPAGFSAEFSNLARELLSMDLPVSDKQHSLVDVICRFETSYRFTRDRGIGLLADAIQAGETQLASSDDDEVMVFGIESLAEDRLRAEISSYYFEYETLLQDPACDVSALLENFDSTRILSPMRDGDLGVEALNREIESHLEARGLKPSAQRFYHGRPIIIMRNDYNLELFNGDVGVCVNDPEDQQIKAAFIDSSGNVKRYLASRLPPHETCFAMTIHKSQGSEFNHVTLVLPEPTTAATEQLLTRELIYTAATRARHSIAIYTNEKTWNEALQRSAGRMSGLASLLTKGETEDKQQDLFPPPS